MSNKSGTSAQAVTLPRGGGALRGIGETFTPDLFSGTGNSAVPIGLPAGRNGFEPQVSLTYSTGNGVGPFGLGWSLSVPGVSRKTARGVPRYRDDAADPADRDTFLLSGTEDLVPIASPAAGVTRFRPRREGQFARIERIRDAGQDFWRVASRDGLVSLYGTAPSGSDAAAVVADPADPRRIFAWKLAETTDPFGNRVEYRYRRDRQPGGPRQWDQAYLEQIRYADFEENGQTRFLVTVTFVYQERPDPLSEYRSGFEIRTRLRCTRIEVRTHADQERLQRTYELDYLDQRVQAGELPAANLPPNRVSLLSQVRVVGHDGDLTQALAPLEFGYSRFEPQRQRFRSLAATDGAMPPRSLANDDLEMVSLFGNGLPDIVQLNGVAQVWRNLGGGTFDAAQTLSEIPAGIRLADPGVQLADMNGDGRADLLVLDRNGYFPQSFQGRWSAQDFVQYQHSPAVTFDDAELRLLDLDGDGVVDALRTGVDLELFLNDPRRGWGLPHIVPRSSLAGFPDLHFSDPRVKLADLSGDNLQDLVLVQQGQIDYWPYLGHGRWGARISMANSPTFQDLVPLPNGGFDPRRVLFGDLDGDGLDDLVYVEPGRMTFWINQGGNGWSEPLIIDGTPPFPDADAVRLSDVFGSGLHGVLWTADQGGQPDHYQFLELTDGVKPYLLDQIDNHMGALTRIQYRSSTEFYRADQDDPATRWKAPLPFPIQVVKRVEVVDQISHGKLSTEYRYHHGYWDGLERELRGFGLVDQLDTESFDDFHTAGLHGQDVPFLAVESARFSPPTLTRTWFHLGDTGDNFQERREVDFSSEYWPQDPPALERPAETELLLHSLPGRARAAALRSLRGSTLRTELYVLDGSERESRPFTVTESQYGVHLVDPPEANSARQHVFFPHPVAQRLTQWERGDDPMTRLNFSDDYDLYGQPRRQVSLAVPRQRDYRLAATAEEPYLVTLVETRYAQRDDAHRYLVDRVASTTSFEIANDGSQAALNLYRQIQAGTAPRTLFGQSFTYYDGDAFVGLPIGQLGEFGAPVRGESLAITEAFLQEAYRGPAGANPAEAPAYLRPDGAVSWPADYPSEFRDLLPALAGYRFADGSDHRVRGYFTPSARVTLDFQVPGLPRRGLAVVERDPLGNDTTTEYDLPYHLLPVRATDAAGMTTSTDYDYRVLQPRMTTDANGNRGAVRYGPLGLVSATAEMAKEGEQAGDTLESPGSRLEYDFLAFQDRQEPVFVRASVRQHHVTDTDVPLPERDETIETVEYSDGFGRLLQSRKLAEDVLFGDPAFGGGLLSADQSSASGDAVARKRAAGDPSNVIVSGWQTYDNKGRVIEKYEPFFSSGFDFDAPGEARMGQKATVFYDPRGRTIRTLRPDGAQERQIHGVPARLDDPDRFAPTAWETYSYDANDLAAVSLHPTETLADGSARPLGDRAPASHHFTPSSIMVDALGRTVLTVQRNRDLADGQGGTLPPIQELRTRSSYDIRGNLLSITDPLDRVAFRYHYDLADRHWRLESMDGGVRRTVLNVLGNLAEQRDSKGALALQAYDRLQRPTRVWARDDQDSPLTLRRRVEYGDGGDATQDQAERAAMRAANLLGQVHRHHDEAGLTVVAAMDFKGNVLDKSRRVIADAPILARFDQAAANAWRIIPFQVDWQPRAGHTLADREAELLEPHAYQTVTSYDGMNRVTRLRFPRDVEGQTRELRPLYNRGGGLEQVWLDDTLYLERIVHDARGQRALIAYGNGVMTRYAYDPRTFRLARLRSERYTVAGDGRFRPSGVALQDFGYDYDLAGNIVGIRDRAAGSGIPNNPQAMATTDAALASLLASGDALQRRFGYDAVYRLLSASGRECDRPPAGPPWDASPRCVDLTRARGYREQYGYDAAGNLARLEHRDDNGAFTRAFELEPDSNRLRTMTIGNNPHQYRHDANGNVRSETSSRHFEWGHGDRLKAFRTQTEGAEPSVHAHYLYGADGERVKKLVRKQGGRFETTHYIDEVFEHHRWGGQAQPGENNHLHLMDDARRIALLRLGLAHPDDAGPPVQFHLGDHLGGSNVVVDDSGGFVNREEFTPYGETSFGSFARKRYRFSGRERDEESGLGHHGARQYAAWSGRWISCDPIGSAGGLNQYRYADSRPLAMVDTAGTEPTPPPDNPDNLGDVAPYNKQPRAGRDGGGARTTENEHVQPKGNLKEMTRNPTTGRSDYTDSHYRKDATVRVERNTALNKTHGNRGGANADNPRTSTLKQTTRNGGGINYRSDVFVPAIQNAIRAARDTLSRVTEAQINRAALMQDANLFGMQTLQQSGNVVRQSGSTVVDVPEWLRFNVEEDLPRSTPKPPTPAPTSTSTSTSTSGSTFLGAMCKGIFAVDVVFTYKAIAAQTTVTGQIKETAAWGGRLSGGFYGGVYGARAGPWGALLGAVLGGIIGDSAVRTLTEPIPWTTSDFLRYR